MTTDPPVGRSTHTKKASYTSRFVAFINRPSTAPTLPVASGRQSKVRRRPIALR